MKYSKIPEIPLEPSVICLGTAMYGSAIDESESFRMLDAFFELGGNFLDTAHIYADWIPSGSGASERTIGKWLNKTGMRDKAVIGTKGGHPDLNQMNIPKVSYRDLEIHLTQSLERLGIDAVDIYWLHRDEPSIPVSEILEILNSFINKRQIKAIGASNWSLTRLKEAQVYAKKHGLHGFCASQTGWSLASIQNAAQIDPTRVYMTPSIFNYHNDNHFPVVAYSSQAAGFFVKEPLRRSGQTGFSQIDWLSKHYYCDDNFQRYDRSKRIGRKYSCQPNDIALSYIFSQPFPAYAIVGARNSQQVKNSCASSRIQLTPNDLHYLEFGGIKQELKNRVSYFYKRWLNKATPL